MTKTILLLCLLSINQLHLFKAGNKIWTKQFGTSSGEIANSVTTDSNNFIYIAGETSGNFDGNTTTSTSGVFVLKLDSVIGNKIWTKQFGSSVEDKAYSVTTDSNNFVYVAGKTSGSLDGNPYAGSSDAFLVKLDSATGNKIWTKQFGTSVTDEARAVTTDSNNFIYVAGFTWGSLDGNYNACSTDAFLVKFDSKGNKLFTKQFGISSYDWAYSVTTDSNNFVYVAGSSDGELDGNANAGFLDAFVIKFDSAGNKIWTKLFGSSRSDYAYSITIDSGKFLYITGFTAGSFAGYTNAGGNDVFVIKLDSATGNKIWINQFGTVSIDRAYSVMTDSSNFVYVAGYTGGSLDGIANNTNPDAFLAKFDSAGSRIWINQFGTSEIDYCLSATIDLNDFVYVSLYTSGTFDGNTSAGSSDVFLVKFDSAETLCDVSCLQCTLDDIKKCTTCASGYYKKTELNFPNECYKTAPQGYFLDVSSYSKCSKRCDSCINSAANCTICASGFYKKAELNFPTECFNPAPLGYFFNGYSFSKCDLSCAACVSPMQCTSCSSGYYKRTELNFPTECFNFALEGYFLDKSKSSYSKCGKSCSSCIDSATNCLSCSFGYFKKKEISFQTECFSVNSAPQGYFFDGFSFTKCSESCSSCVSATQCTSCAFNFYKKTELNYPTECFNSAPQGYFLAGSSFSKCDVSCAACVSPMQCTMCASGYFKIPELNFPTECFNFALEGYFLDKSTSSYSKCDKNCSSCIDSASNCTSCKKGYYKKANISFPKECIYYDSAPQGHFFDGLSFTECNESCSSCVSSMQCTSCASGYNKKAELSFPTKCYSSNAPQGNSTDESANDLKCDISCASCATTDSKCDTCASGYYKKAELSFPTECFSNAPQGYFLDGSSSTFSKCYERCVNCTGANPQDCIITGNTNITCIRDCLVCKISETCEVCKEGFTYVKSSNTCIANSNDNNNNSNNNNCKTFDSNKKCSECVLGYTLENNACVCKGVLDQNNCCSPLDFCKAENTKYFKEIEKCGCQMCEMNKLRYNYQCLLQTIPDSNCFIFDKEKFWFIQINSNDCIDSFPNVKVIYNKFCFSEKHIKKFNFLDSEYKRIFVFSMDEKGVYQYIKYFYAYEKFLDLECNEKIHSYFYLGLRCDVAFDGNFIYNLKKSKNFNFKNSEKIKNEVITHDFLKDVFKAYLDDCDGEINSLNNEDLINLCFSSNSTMFDLEKNICKSSTYCSKIDQNLLTFINQNECFKCVSADFTYDRDIKRCFTYFVRNGNLRSFCQTFFIIIALAIFLFLLYLGYSYLFNYKENNEMQMKTMDLAIILYAVIDFSSDLSFLLGSAYINNHLKNAVFVFFLLQPIILFIAIAILIIIEKVWEERFKHYFFILLLFAIIIGFPLMIICMLQLPGKFFEKMNRPFTGFVKKTINLSFWIKLIDLCFEIAPQLILKIIVISTSGYFNHLNIASLILNLISLILSLIYLRIECKKLEKIEPGAGKNRKAPHDGKLFDKNCNQEINKEIKNDSCSKLEIKVEIAEEAKSNGLNEDCIHPEQAESKKEEKRPNIDDDDDVNLKNEISRCEGGLK